MDILQNNNNSGKEEHPVRCTHCASTVNIRHGKYQRAHPHKPELVNVQRYLCKSPVCLRKTFSILPFPFLPIIRHFHQTLFCFYTLFSEEKRTQADTARQLGVLRGVSKRLTVFCGRFIPWFNREKHIGEWGPDPEANPACSWPNYTRDFSQALYPRRWVMY